MAQPQTNDGVGTICSAIAEIELKKGHFVYLDLLSNFIYMDTDEDGLQIPPTKMAIGNSTWKEAWEPA